eukprot:Polyplicarium_translucidae@DN1056_c0_g1_i2.p1
MSRVAVAVASAALVALFASVAYQGYSASFLDAARQRDMSRSMETYAELLLEVKGEIQRAKEANAKVAGEINQELQRVVDAQNSIHSSSNDKLASVQHELHDRLKDVEAKMLDEQRRNADQVKEDMVKQEEVVVKAAANAVAEAAANAAPAQLGLGTAEGRMTVPVSLLIPCVERHFSRMASLFKSVNSQTVMPVETLVALSIASDKSAEFDWKDVTALGIPNLKLFVRGGRNFAGSNRQYLADQATGELLSFFDCDDFMHPQRTEILWRLFKQRPEVEALLHGFKSFNNTSWHDGGREAFLAKRYTDEEIDRWSPPWEFDEIRQQEPITRLWGGKEWNVSDPESEPNHNKSIMEHWWFPRFMKLPGGGPRTSPHNGWLTLRSGTSHAMPYPDTPRGQDSLYNWRLIKSGVNWTHGDFVLGAYLHG